MSFLRCHLLRCLLLAACLVDLLPLPALSSEALPPSLATPPRACSEPTLLPVKGTLYIHVHSFRRGRRRFGIEEIIVHELETGREWKNTFNIQANYDSDVTLTCDDATVGSHCDVYVRWHAKGRAHRHDDDDDRHERRENRDRGDCDEFDNAEHGRWERQFYRSGQVETFYNP